MCSITISRDYGSFVKASNGAEDTQIHLRPSTRAHTHNSTLLFFLFHQFSLESHTWQHGRQLLQRCQRTTGVQTADTGRSQHWPTPSIYDKDCQIRHNVSFCIVCQVFLCCSAILPAEFQQSWGGKVNSCVWLFGFVFFFGIWHLVSCSSASMDSVQISSAHDIDAAIWEEDKFPSVCNSV